MALSRSNRATSALTNLHLSGRLNCLNSLTVYGIPNSSLIHRSSLTLVAGTNARVNITSAGTFAARLAILLVLITGLSHLGNLSTSVRRSVIRNLRTLPDHVRRVLSRSGHVRTLTRSFSSGRRTLFLNHNSRCPVTLRNTLGLGRVSCVRTRTCTTNRLGRNPLTLVSTSVPIVIITPGGRLLRGLGSGVRRIHTHNNRLCIFTSRSTNFMDDSGVRVVRVPRIRRIVTPVFCAIPLRLLTCRITLVGNASISRPHGLTGSIAIRWSLS